MKPAAAQRREPLGLLPDRAVPRLYERVIEVLRAGHYSGRTEQAYVHWIRRFILFQNHRHPAEMAEPEIKTCLTHLAVKNTEIDL